MVIGWALITRSSTKFGPTTFFLASVCLFGAGKDAELHGQGVCREGPGSQGQAEKGGAADERSVRGGGSRGPQGQAAEEAEDTRRDQEPQPYLDFQEHLFL